MASTSRPGRQALKRPRASVAFGGQSRRGARAVRPAPPAEAPPARRGPALAERVRQRLRGPTTARMRSRVAAELAHDDVRLRTGDQRAGTRSRRTPRRGARAPRAPRSKSPRARHSRSTSATSSSSSLTERASATDRSVTAYASGAPLAVGASVPPPAALRRRTCRLQRGARGPPGSPAAALGRLPRLDQVQDAQVLQQRQGALLVAPEHHHREALHGDDHVATSCSVVLALAILARTTSAAC